VTDIIDPKLLNSIEGLELTAKIIVEGYFSGYNQSKRVGVGHEFSQYRSYQPGDDLRLMDWKMYARSERFYVRQSEIETNINIKFIIDASNSMAHQDGELTKMDYARMLTAALGYLAKNQGDAYGVLWANNKEVNMLHSRQDQLHFQRFLFKLLSIKPGDVWLKNYDKLDRFYDPRNRELIIFISDMYDDEQDLIDFAKQLKNNRNEVIVFHLIAGNELNPKLQPDGLYEDLETGVQVRFEPGKGAKDVSALVNKSTDIIRASLLKFNVGYELFRTDQPLDVALTSFIKKRNQLI
jgi:uncharacterized protein (DUF58 family)